jgi:asparagine synthase (glutamine-hydrolysing)
VCGIAGVFGKADPATVVRCWTRSSWGPDDGHLCGEDFTVGARRLRHHDLEGGRQPLTNEDGSVVAAQNGEIYNFPELRPTLLAAGHRLQTHTDTEVLPHLWEDHGERLPEYIQGMFAIAVWDSRQRVGLLARDRMGKKPLYYWEHDGALYFASELKALLVIPGFTRRLNHEALHHYLSYKHVPHPLTIFEGVRMLPPAHRLVYRAGARPEISRYWSLSFAPRDGDVPAEQDVVDELLARMRTAVRRRLMSDVPVGFFLSGGLDSSLTTALATEVAPGRIKTFTLTYADTATTAGKEEDRRWARWVADRYGTDHFEESIAVTNYPEQLRAILRSFDEPFAGTVSTYFLAERMARHVKVAVAGDGADELFGSYLSHRVAAGAEAMAGTAGLADWEWRARLFVLNEEEKQIALFTGRSRQAGQHRRQAFS